MAKLCRKSNGTLIKKPNGKLAVEPCDCEGAVCEECPDCEICTPIMFSVTGFTGCCACLNGTYTLSLGLMTCVYGGGSIAVPPCQIVNATLICSGGVWTLNIFGSPTADQINSGTCPGGIGAVGTFVTPEPCPDCPTSINTPPFVMTTDTPAICGAQVGTATIL